ncbi:MAG: cobyric acid synthase [Hyphomicrobium zavarzinii]|uniref:cobyric acid synthase n=1 Tax=Hyphomicrobium zavarzinii TaxID=48292 RepID=UPI001A4468E9|nr:cobyric acid synthase [Hyphomicrobium zavarzinii]MBL8844668.1 cobyric acid synthase [Hyphomicrobium zavarzinii]
MKAIMFQGTGSDVGKSLLVAGLARAFANRGLRVRPFKPQNMSNNAAVTPDGGEIGRAQALQARAARIAPTVHMNPVLLKPQSEIGAQVVVQGRVIGNAPARGYHDMKPRLMAAVLDSFERLSQEADIVLVEGAGSASEINLRKGDIANMGFARAADVPVVLIGDIERGGIFASLAGTRAVITPEDAAMVEGFIVNKFRGDPALFATGLDLIAQQTGWSALGLVPYFTEAANLPAEDSQSLVTGRTASGDASRPLVVVLAYPRLSNFDDFDPLRLEPGIDFAFLRPGEPIPGTAALVILPGSKSTIADLAALRKTGWDIDLAAHVRRGGHVLGICGGYQMLGREIADPGGIEGPAGSTRGLGLLDVETMLAGDKMLVDVAGTAAGGIPIKGYEMHVGRTNGPGCANPMLQFSDGRRDGAVSPSGRISGCYVHGLFASDAYRSALLDGLGATSGVHDYEAGVDATLDALAAHLEAHLDCDRILEIARTPTLASSV